MMFLSNRWGTNDKEWLATPFVLAANLPPQIGKWCSEKTAAQRILSSDHLHSSCVKHDGAGAGLNDSFTAEIERLIAKDESIVSRCQMDV